MSLSCIHDDSDQLTMTFKMTPCCITQPAALKALGNRNTCERLHSLKYDLQENTFNYKVALITVAFVNVLFFFVPPLSSCVSSIIGILFLGSRLKVPSEIISTILVKCKQSQRSQEEPPTRRSFSPLCNNIFLLNQGVNN